MSIYKACDIRGVYGAELDEQHMQRIGRAVGSILVKRLGREPSVLVAGDLRPSTPSLKQSLTDGLLATGAQLIDIGVAPTPLFYHTFRELAADAAAMVTASHNPPEFNGLKLCLSRRPITPEEIDLVRDTVEKGDFAQGHGTGRDADLAQSYEDFFASSFPRRIPLKVVVDAGNGCFWELAPRVLERLGFEVTRLFCEPDGSFPNRSANPATDPLDALCETVRRTEAHFGLALDGDGDRAAFVDEQGRRVVNDKAIVLLGRHALATGARLGVREKVVCDLNCSQVVPEEMAKCGAEPLSERAGYAFIKSRMIDEDAILGGEISGHVFYRALGGGDDALYAATQMGRLLLREGRPLSTLADEIPSYAITPPIRLECEGDLPARAVEAIVRHAEGRHEIIRLDGVKVQYVNGWALARPSITEPVLAMRFEAREPGQLAPIIRDFLEPVPDVLEYALRKVAECFPQD